MRQSIQICIVILALMLFGSTSLVYSQDGVEQSNGDTKTSEQPKEEQTNGKQPTTGKTDEEPNPLQSRIINQERKTRDLTNKLNNLENLPDTPLRTIALIYGVLTFLAFAVFIFLGLRMNKQWQNRLDEKDRSLQERLTENQNKLNERLKNFSKQGIELNKKLEEIESNRTSISQKQEQFLSNLDKLNNRIDDIELNILSVESEPETDSIVDYQSQVALIIQEEQVRMDDLADAYRNGEPFELDEIENPSPSQKAILLLNSLVRDLHQWKSELSSEADPKLIETLTFRETDIKNKLKEIRGKLTPNPKALHLPINVSTDTEYDDVQKQCTVDVARFEGMLSWHEQSSKVDLDSFNDFILQFIKDKLFNGVARFITFDQVPGQLSAFLDLVGYEVVPIEIGKTKANARYHDIQGSQHTGVEAGTIAEVVLPGLRRITDEEIVQKPVVIRAE